MPLIQVKLIENVFTETQKRVIVRKLTDAMVSIEGENMRPVTFVTVDEVKSGDWGIGGKAADRGRGEGNGRGQTRIRRRTGPARPLPPEPEPPHRARRAVASAARGRLPCSCSRGRFNSLPRSGTIESKGDSVPGARRTS